MLDARMLKKPIIHMEFQDAAECEDDEFWGHQLLLAARGVFKDKKIIYDKGFLVKKDIRQREPMPKNNPKALAKAFINFHKSHNEISSPEELVRQQMARDQLISRVIFLNWEAYTKDQQRSRLFDYAERKTKELQMTEQQRASLFRCVEIGLAEESITSSHIILEQNTVKDILCIKQRVDGSWYITTNGNLVKRKPRAKNKNKQISVEDKWAGILNTYSRAP